MKTQDGSPVPAHILYSPQYFIPVAVAVVYSELDFSCLFVKSRTDGSWSLPTAAMMPGESAEDAAKRAVLEQSGLLVGAGDPFIADSGKYARAPGRPHAQMIRFGFRFSQWEGNLETRTETTIDARMVADGEAHEALLSGSQNRTSGFDLSYEEATMYSDHECTLEREVPAEGGIVWVR